MRHPRGLQLAHVAQQRPRRPDRRYRIGSDAEPFQRVHAEVARHFFTRQIGVEFPTVALRDQCAIRMQRCVCAQQRSTASDQHLAGRESSQRGVAIGKRRQHQVKRSRRHVGRRNT